MENKKKWEIIHESDTESGKPTCWALEINHEKYGKYVWISGYLAEDEETIETYVVEVAYYYNTRLDEMKPLVECKSLASAKRWVTMNLL